MKKFLLIAIIAIALIIIAIVIYAKFFMFVPDKGGMTYKSDATLDVTPYNSGSDEFGNSVGYGQGETETFEIKEGDVFYEAMKDSLVQNLGKEQIKDCYGKLFEITSLSEDGITIDENGEERNLHYGQKFYYSSTLMVLDGASTSYTLVINKNK